MKKKRFSVEQIVAVSVKAEDEKAAVCSLPPPHSAIELRHSRGWSLKIEPGFDAVHLRHSSATKPSTVELHGWIQHTG